VRFLAALIVVVFVGLVSPAWAAIERDGDLIVRFDAGLKPAALPRESPAPVAVRVAGDIGSVSGDTSRIPQLRQLSVAINSGGQLNDRGLPVCRRRQIRSASEELARRVCGDAIIGGGQVLVQVRIPTQPPFMVRARLLVFNGPRSKGDKLIFAQIYARKPPGTLILPFEVTQQSGTYGVVLTTTLPPRARRWAYLTRFGITLFRTYRVEDHLESFISAACSAPVGFTETLFPFARAIYAFDDGRRLTLSQTGRCKVAD